MSSGSLKRGTTASSPENYQPYEFVVTDDPGLWAKLTEAKVESRESVLRRASRTRTAMETVACLVAVCYGNMDANEDVGDMNVSLSRATTWVCMSYVWPAATPERLGLSPAFYPNEVYDRVKSLLGLPLGKELAAVLRIRYPKRKPSETKKTVQPVTGKLHVNRF